MKSRRRDERGVVLALVLILGLILTTAVVSFQRRAVIDAMIVRNREQVSRAEALAHSGIEIAKVVLLEQTYRKIDIMKEQGDDNELVGNTQEDLWSAVGDYELITPEGGSLRVSIFDARARLNLNALVTYGTNQAAGIPDAPAPGQPGLGQAPLQDEDAEDGEADENDPSTQTPTPSSDQEGKPHPEAEEFLVDFFDHVIERMDGTAAEKEYDSRELAENLLDYMDADMVRVGGGEEEDFYQSQDPPYLPANRPLLSVQEIGLIEGFDSHLVEALQPYVTVYPIIRAPGVNLNTAPAHVLGAVSHGVGGDKRLFNEDDVTRILETRDEELIFCDNTETDPDRCITLEQADLEGPIFPPGSILAMSFVYRVIAEAHIGDVERSVEAVLDVSSIANPQVLFWRMR